MAIQRLSEKAFKLCRKSGVLEKLAKELDGDDILLRLNSIELLTQLADSGTNGLMFVEESGIANKLNNLLITAEVDPLISLMLPSKILFLV